MLDNPKQLHRLRPTNTSSKTRNIRNFVKTLFTEYIALVYTIPYTQYIRGTMSEHKKIFKSAPGRSSTDNGRTLDWYVKWLASIVLLFAFSVRGIPEYALYDGILSLVGLLLWLWVSLLWNDRALIVLNAVGVVLVARNLLLGLGITWGG